MALNLWGGVARRRPRFSAVSVFLQPAFLSAFMLAACGSVGADNGEDLDLRPRNESSTIKAIPSPDADAAEDSVSEKEAKTPQEKERQTKIRQIKATYIDTSIEEKPAESSQTAESTQKSPEFLEREAKLSEPLKLLLDAPYLFDFSRGGSSEYASAYAQVAKQGASARADLLFIVENGSPAGKIYAALLLRSFDLSTAMRYLSQFKNAKTLVKTKSYTSQEHYTTGEVITDLLSATPTIRLSARD